MPPQAQQGLTCKGVSSSSRRRDTEPSQGNSPRRPDAPRRGEEISSAAPSSDDVTFPPPGSATRKRRRVVSRKPTDIRSIVSRNLRFPEERQAFPMAEFLDRLSTTMRTDPGLTREQEPKYGPSQPVPEHHAYEPYAWADRATEIRDIAAKSSRQRHEAKTWVLKAQALNSDPTDAAWKRIEGGKMHGIAQNTSPEVRVRQSSRTL